jgi:hypothetical protein
VVHGVVEALRLHHPHPQLPGLLLGQHPEPPNRGRPALLLLLRRRGSSRLDVDVVRLAGPPQQRRPPLGAPARIGAEPRTAGGGAGAGPGPGAELQCSTGVS